MAKVLHGCLGTVKVVDDVLVFGKVQEEHDQRINDVLERLQKHGLTINDKHEFNKSSVTFYGMEVSDKGIRPLESTVEAITSIRAPQNAAEVASFLSAANFYMRFLPDFATLSEPLKELLRKEATWQWEAKHNVAFCKIKQLLTESPVLTPFNPESNLILTTDASNVGIGAVMSQEMNGEESVVAYASRTLTSAERNYSTAKKEALAIVWTTLPTDGESLFGRITRC